MTDEDELIGAEEARAAMESGDALLVCAYEDEDDAREVLLEGAILLGELEARRDAGLEKERTIIFYCDCPHEEAALERAGEWREAGFSDVRCLEGGVKGWKAAGFALASDLALTGDRASRASEDEGAREQGERFEGSRDETASVGKGDSYGEPDEPSGETSNDLSAEEEREVVGTSQASGLRERFGGGGGKPGRSEERSEAERRDRSESEAPRARSRSRGRSRSKDELAGRSSRRIDATSEPRPAGVTGADQADAVKLNEAGKRATSAAGAVEAGSRTTRRLRAGKGKKGAALDETAGASPGGGEPTDEQAASRGRRSEGKRARDVMTRDPTFVDAGASIQEAAVKMRDCDCGSLPVRDAKGRFVGMITDRDIALRCVAEGKDVGSCSVEDCMTRELVCCDEEASVTEVGRVMQEHQIRRIPVLRKGERDKDHPAEVVGIISLGDLATDLQASPVPAATLKKVSQPAHAGA